MKVRATLFSLMVAFAASGAMRAAAPDIHDTRLLMDGATITAPNLAIWDAEKGWIVENEGVPPDIEVEQTPADVIAGRDPQLERQG